MRFVTITAAIIIAIDVSTSTDPCIGAQDLHSPGKRGGQCIISKWSKQICDRYIIEGWYKVQHEDDVSPRQMIDKCLQFNTGGTLFPVWLNGSHPTNLQDVVNRTVCQSGTSSCCDNVFQIQIKRCVGYFVYWLPPLKECQSAYGFGEIKECAIDPCDDDTYVVLDDNGDRSTNCYRKDNSMPLCDNTLSYKWYRVKRNGADIQMPTACVTAPSCSSLHPIWLRGKPPSIVEKTSRREVCVAGTSCCEKSYNIYMRNCTNFLVYNFTHPTDCPERYCFGNSSGCSYGKQIDRKTNEDDGFSPFKMSLIVTIVILGMSAIVILSAVVKNQLLSKLKVSSDSKATKLAENNSPQSKIGKEGKSSEERRSSESKTTKWAENNSLQSKTGKEEKSSEERRFHQI